MPKQHSKFRTRNEQIFARWDRLADEKFTTLGVSREALKQMQKDMLGAIVLPGDPSYDQDRMLFNPVFNPLPCVIMYCESEDDVRVALNFSRQNALGFTVRSGGHCTAGFSGGYGVLIDVSGLQDVVISPDGSSVTVGTGCPFKKFYAALESRGLHVPAGECDDVCVGGFVQGGGIGFTSGSFGMNCDNVESLRVMLWDGSVVVATENQNMDLWWAMRGGTGGNFGILLEVTYMTYQLQFCTGWALAWSMATPQNRADCVNALLTAQRAYMVGSPYGSNLTLQVLMVWQNILDPTQPPLTNKIPVFMVRGLWVGTEVDARKSMAPMLSLPGCVTQFVITDRFTKVLDNLLSNPQDQPVVDPTMGMPNEDKSSRYVSTPLSAAACQEILDYFATQSPNDLTYAYLEVYSGRITAYPRQSSAFIHRDALFNTVLDVFWYLPKDRQNSETFMNGWNTMIEKYWNGEVYQNYPSIAVPNYVQNYWADAAQTLSAVKMKYDPNEYFRFAQQVPATSGFDPGVGPVIPGYEAVLAAWAKPIDYSGGQPPSPGASPDGKTRQSK